MKRHGPRPGKSTHSRWNGIASSSASTAAGSSPHSVVGSGPESAKSSPSRNVSGAVRRPAVEISRYDAATRVEDQTFENPKTGAVLETAFVYQDGTKGTDLYLSVTSRSTLPPNPYRR